MQTDIATRPIPLKSSRRRVLVVDDEIAIVFALREFLEARGYHVDSAVGTPECRRLLRDAQYDVIITDLHLTRSGGREGLEVLRMARGSGQPMRSIMLTAYTSDLDTEEARDLGVDRLFTKPVDLPQLEATVAALCEGNQR